MVDREMLRRIATVRRLREVTEKAAARKVAEARNELERARRAVARLDSEIDIFKKEHVSRLAAGTISPELVDAHRAWIALKERRRIAGEVVRDREEKVKLAMETYLGARVERKKMETWEENTAVAIKSEENRKMTIAIDEIAVIRHARKEGGHR